MLSPKELIHLCLECMSSYDSSIHTPNIHVDLFIQRYQQQCSNNSDSKEHHNHRTSNGDVISIDLNDMHSITFLHQIVEQWQLHLKLINLLVDTLYHYNSTTISRSNRMIYVFFTLLHVLLCDDVTDETYNKLVYTQKPHIIIPFLQFYDINISSTAEDLSSSLSTSTTVNHHLHHSIIPILSSIYDTSYVHSVLIPRIEKHRESRRTFLEELLWYQSTYDEKHKNRSENLIHGKTLKKSVTTVVKPFDLTQPTVRDTLPASSLDDDIRRPASQHETAAAVISPHDLTSLLYNTPTLAELEKKRIERRKQLLEQKKQEHTQRVKTPLFATTQRISQKSMNPHTHRKQGYSSSDDATHSDTTRSSGSASSTTRFRAKSPPTTTYSDTQRIPSKLTVASILREELLYQRKLEEDKQQQLKLIHEILDDSELRAYHQKREREAEEQRVKEIQQRKQQNEQTLLNVMNAIKEKQVINQKHAETLKKQLLDEKQHYERQLEIELKHKQQQAIRIQEELSTVPIVKRNEVMESKKHHAQWIKQQTQQAIEEIHKQREAERLEKQKIIHEIQNMLVTAAARTTRLREEKLASIDMTTSSNQMLLSEMSIVNLHERLQQMKTIEQEELERKREKIYEEKSKKQEVLQWMQRRHQKLHEKQSEEIKPLRDQKIHDALQLAKQKQLHSEEQQKTAQQHITVKHEKRRQEAMKLINDLKKKQREVQRWQYEKNLIDQQRERDLEMARERQNRMEADRAVRVAHEKEATEKKYKKQYEVLKQQQNDEEEMMKAQKQHEIEVKMEENSALTQLINDSKKKQAKKIKQERENAIEKRREAADAIKSSTQRFRPFSSSMLSDTTRSVSLASTLAASLASTQRLENELAT